jgi:hypothetical protein
MVSITGSDRAFGKFIPRDRSACSCGVCASVISLGRQPSTTTTYTRFLGTTVAEAVGAPGAAETTTAAPLVAVSCRKRRRLTGAAGSVI